MLRHIVLGCLAGQWSPGKLSSGCSHIKVMLVGPSGGHVDHSPIKAVGLRGSQPHPNRSKGDLI